MMLLPTPGAAQQSSAQSGLEGLLEQLQQLQEEGLFGATGAVGLQGLDQLREEAAGQFEQSTFGFGERTQERFRVPALSSGERLLIQGFCSGEISEAEERLLRLVTRFSLLERDYCRRAGESLFQFGYEFFEGFLGPEFLVNGAIQDDYVLGIGDVLVIIFHGRDAQTVTARIDREGRMMIPNMAPIAVAGRTFGEVRRELEARTAATLTGTEVFVSLGTVRQLSVVVAGEVTRPGVHQVTGLSTALDAIGLAGGVKKTGSLRRIQIRRDDRIFWIDLYDLLLAGGIGLDLGLFDGDFIIVPVIGPTVAVSGQVKRPGIYEMPEGAKQVILAELVDLAGGTVRPKGNRFSLIAFDDDGRERISDREDTGTAVMDGEIVIVNRGHDIQLGTVELVGHVRVPGRRPLSAAPSMRALIGDAASLAENP